MGLCVKNKVILNVTHLKPVKREPVYNFFYRSLPFHLCPFYYVAVKPAKTE